jgi:predicted kinase
MKSQETKLKIIAAAEKAVEQLIKVAEEEILKKEEDGSEIAADRLKNAAATKKLAVFDAFEILNRIELERENIDLAKRGVNSVETRQGFAERRSK